MAAYKSFFRPEYNEPDDKPDSVNAPQSGSYTPQDQWLSNLAREAAHRKASTPATSERIHLTLLPNVSSGGGRLSFLPKKRPVLRLADEVAAERYAASRDMEVMMLDIAYRVELFAIYFQRESNALARRNVREPLKRARKALGYITRQSDREELRERKQERGLFDE